jgi:hypothetical protein
VLSTWAGMAVTALVLRALLARSADAPNTEGTDVGATAGGESTERQGGPHG